MARMLGHSDARTDNTSRFEVLRRRALVGASALTVDPPVSRLPNVGVSRRRGLTLAIVAVPPTDRHVLVRTWVGLTPSPIPDVCGCGRGACGAPAIPDDGTPALLVRRGVAPLRKGLATPVVALPTRSSAIHVRLPLSCHRALPRVAIRLSCFRARRALSQR